MKKLTGWILIILCSLFLVIFAICMMIIIPETFTTNPEFQISTGEILTTLLGFVFMISILIFGLRSGLKRVKNEPIIKPVNYDKELSISLTGQIQYIDYRNLILGLSFKKPVYLVALGIMLLYSFAFLIDRENITNRLDSNYFRLIIIGALLLTPVFTLIKIKKLYNTNKLFQEQLSYSLTNESISIKGSTVDSIQKWAHFYQIRETKHFFMFYQGEMVATLLDKKMFSNSELEEFNTFIKSLNVKRA